MTDHASPPSPRNAAAHSDDGVPASVNAFLHAQRSVPKAGILARLFGRSPVPRNLHHAYREALGDVAVIEALAQLEPDWIVRMCAPAPSTGAAFVAVGSPGVLWMTVRHRAEGAVWIDGNVLLVEGERKPDLRDAEFGAVRLSQTLSDAVGFRVEATSCLVLVGSRSLTVAKPPRRVAVLTPRDIRGWLKGLSATLSERELEAVRETVDSAADWHALDASNPSGAHALDAFRKVRAAMGHARHVRLTWVTGALVLLWLIAVVGIGGVTTSFLVH